jgi:hypothetical protein
MGMDEDSANRVLKKDGNNTYAPVRAAYFLFAASEEENKCE